jgi:hypothetical protein
MIPLLAAVLLSPAAAAAPAPAPAAVQVSSAPAGIGMSTYTVSTMYTGDRVRDPFMPPSAGAPARPREKGAPLTVDIHALQLRGIMQDGREEYALFGAEGGETFVLRGGRLYADKKPVPGITGRIHIKQKRAELVTADKDVQIFGLGELDDAKAKKP